jgi:UDPglucose 6-dehydrogenase
MKIAVIGTGYVGLVTGTCFADFGNEVVCIDKDEAKVALLQKGGIPIYEPGLEEMVERNNAAGRLSFTTDLAKGIKPAQLIFIAVGTPQADTGAADLSTVFAVADTLAEKINGPKIVVIKSTVPVGTNRAVAERIAARSKHTVDVASNPEFLKEGAAIEDCTKPDRVVVGVRRAQVADVLRELYAPFLRTERPFLVMSPESAEMTKYAANAMLATKISYINEMANLCERVGADINDVRRGIGHDARIGFQFLFPGAGYGGSCFEGQETLFVVDEAAGVTATSFQILFERMVHRSTVQTPLPMSRQGADRLTEESMDAVLIPAGDDSLRVLAFDLHTHEPTIARVHALTRRTAEGSMIHMRTAMGRSIRVTEDHPVIRWRKPEMEIVPAGKIEPADQLALLTSLPDLQGPAALDLIELLDGCDLEEDILVAPTDDSFTTQYSRFAPYISAEVLRYPVEIRNHNRMRLVLFRQLRQRGLVDVPTCKLQLHTAKGAGTRLDALLPIDEDFARLCGYYLAEGLISKDIGRCGATRERIGFSFHVEEKDHISDVQRILQRWGLKFTEKVRTNRHTTIVSSRVLAWLFRDVLGMGVRSEDKALPRIAFGLSVWSQQELVRGAFSGDGAVTPLHQGKNLMFEYATVSKRLADSMAILLQSLGIVSSIRQRWMNKSKRKAFILRISGHEQMHQLGEVFGTKHQAGIARILTGDERHIRQHGFTRQQHTALVKVRTVETEAVSTPVYSLETSSGTVIVSSGIVIHNCFPKDIRALIYLANSKGSVTHLMQSVDQVNEAQKQVLWDKVRQHYGDSLKGKTLAIWGLAFKPRTDDIREAPALVLIDHLLKAGVKLRVHDPEAMRNVQALYGDKLVYCDKPYGALESADGLVIVTEWQQFRNPDFVVMRRLLSEPVLFDGRNLYEPRMMAEAGFTYYSIGRETVHPRRT